MPGLEFFATRESNLTDVFDYEFKLYTLSDLCVLLVPVC
jgi:hypothetical protein